MIGVISTGWRQTMATVRSDRNAVSPAARYDRRMPLLAALLALLACSKSEPTPRPDSSAAQRPLWVLAPHPDDEVLFGAEPIARALGAGRAVWVVLATHGDLGCERDGWRRQRETVAAMAVLGLPEDRIRFLGYPDGFLDALGPIPLPPVARRLADGSCGRGAETYGARGQGGADVHRVLFGAPAPYTDASVVGDLVALLERDRPGDVYVSHPIDDHPDHATLYVLLRRALERARLDRLPRVHRALVHVGGCWPNGNRPNEPCPPIDDVSGTPYPALPGPLARYTPNERWTVADGGARARRAIAEHRSQLHGDVEHDWLGTFARGEAIYWAERLVRQGARVVRSTAEGVPPGLARPRVQGRAPGEGLHAVVQRAPLTVAFEAAVPEGGSALVRALARQSAPDEGLALVIEDGRSVAIRRGRERVLRQVRVPNDGALHARHRWEMRLDPRPDDGGVLEIEIRRDGTPFAYAVDPDPILEGDAVLVETSGGATVTALQTSAVAPVR